MILEELSKSEQASLDAHLAQRRRQSEWLENDTARNENFVATQFVDANHERIRYILDWDAWTVWDGTRWVLDANSARIAGLARNFAKELWSKFHIVAENCEPRKLSKICMFLKGCNGAVGIQNLVRLSRSDPRVMIGLSSLDTVPHLLNLLNGTVDLLEGTIRPHSHTDLITQRAEVRFDPSATCPRWEAALSLIFSGDQELIRYVRQIFGYSISAECGKHILPIGYGSGFNGKSFVWNTLLRIFGDYGGLANETLLLGFKDSHPTEKAFLYGKRFVPISEPEQNARLREARVKELTGDSTITARRMHENFWSFRRTHTFFLATNHKPKISGNDEGIWRRVKLIPFTVDLRTVTDPIDNFDEILANEEGPGILNWLIAGYRDFRENGFKEPECVRVATADYRQDEDELAQFVTDRCVTGSAYQVPANAVYRAYQAWGGQLTATAFGKALGARFERLRPTSGSFRKTTLYLGLDLAGDEAVDDF